MEEKLCSPEIIVESVGITEFGDLPQGLYFYSVTYVTQNMESQAHLIQVYARYKENSVILHWKPVKGVNEYRVYRGQDMYNLDGYFTVYDQTYFHDNGLGELNVLQ